MSCLSQAAAAAYPSAKQLMVPLLSLINEGRQRAAEVYDIKVFSSLLRRAGSAQTEQVFGVEPLFVVEYWYEDILLQTLPNQKE